jgi:hypothetical protein
LGGQCSRKEHREREGLHIEASFRFCTVDRRYQEQRVIPTSPSIRRRI